MPGHGHWVWISVSLRLKSVAESFRESMGSEIGWQLNDTANMSVQGVLSVVTV